MPRASLVSGVLPGRLVENSGAGDWAATLSLSGDLVGPRRGGGARPDALDFSASLLPGLDAVGSRPVARWISNRGRARCSASRCASASPMAACWDDPAARSVTVLDMDDTAPTGLAFASGGTGGGGGDRRRRSAGWR